MSSEARKGGTVLFSGLEIVFLSIFFCGRKNRRSTLNFKSREEEENENTSLRTAEIDRNVMPKLRHLGMNTR